MCVRIGSCQLWTCSKTVGLAMISFQVLPQINVHIFSRSDIRTFLLTATLWTRNFLNPSGIICLVFLFDPYPILGINRVPRNRRRTQLSIPFGLRQLGCHKNQTTCMLMLGRRRRERKMFWYITKKMIEIVEISNKWYL